MHSCLSMSMDIKFIVLLVSLSLFGCLPEVFGQGVIRSIGQCSNENNTWALGISDLKFEVTFTASTYMNATGLIHQMRWVIDEKSVALFDVEEGKGCLNNKPAANASFSVTEVTCEPGLSSQLTLDTSNEMNSISQISVFIDRRSSLRLNVSVIECNKDVIGEVLISGNARYNGNATLSCNNAGVLVNSTSKLLPVQNTVTCSPCAKWVGISEFACWKAPKISIMFQEAHSTYIHNQTAEFTCNIQPGKPRSTTAQLCVGDKYCSLNQTQSFTHNVTMVPEYNGLRIGCDASNDYLKHTKNGNTASSNKSLLNIRFGPYRPSKSVDCTTSNKFTFNISLRVELYANPSCIDLLIIGAENNLNRKGNVSGAENCCGVARQFFEYMLSNINISDTITINCTVPNNINVDENINLSVYKELDVTTTCTVQPQTTRMDTTNNQQSPTTNNGPSAPSLSVGAIAGIAGGGFLLIVLTTILIIRIVHRRKTAEFAGDVNVNPAFIGSSGSQTNPEHEDRENVLYVTSVDLKSGGGGSGEMVDNVLYGSTPAPRDTNGSDPNQELYSVVQKTKKTKGKAKGVDPGASTSGLQSDDTYAEVNKDRKKKKDGKKAGKGQENSGFAGDAQQDATYAVVDKKKNKGAKGKKAEEPGTSGLVEEATYAVVNKKDKKPKKDGPDDDLHGSNKS